ncbi:MAG: endonuclease/exonuclease/phosphatase family protein [Pirellulales bacterium]
MKALRVAVRWAVWGGTAICLAAILIHATVRDRWLGISTLYYATPPAVVAIFGLICAAGWLVLRRRAAAAALLVLALLCTGWWYRASFVEHAGGPRPGDLDVLFWNTARGSHGWAKVFANIRQQQPEIVGIVEAGYRDTNFVERWREAFPEYAHSDTGGNMLLMCRGKITRAHNVDLGDDGTYKHVLVEIDGRRLRVILVDLAANPFYSRGRPLARLTEDVRRLSDVPLIVMGDFNTPAESVHFRSLRNEMTHAFENAGDGYLPTWPLPVPVLKLDHIWFNEHVAVSACRAGWASGSDHRHLRCFLQPRE